MKKFKYQGPVNSGVTLRINDADTDVLFFQGMDYELHEGDAHIQTLVALGYLVPVDVSVATADQKEKATKGGK